nr:MAG TPA: hypothetical protein [Caudoviricetes sp.]
MNFLSLKGFIEPLSTTYNIHLQYTLKALLPPWIKNFSRILKIMLDFCPKWAYNMIVPQRRIHC